MIVRRPLLCQLMLFLYLCAGCATGLTVEANGSRKTDQPIPSHVTYAVFPTAEVEKDPAFPTYARLVSTEMIKRDYKETEATVAKLGVYLAYKTTKQLGAPQSASPGPPMGSMGPSGGSGGGYGGGGGGGGDGDWGAGITPAKAAGARPRRTL